MELRQALVEMFQKAMPALHNATDEVLPVNVRNNFHSGDACSGPRDVRTQQILVIGEHLAALPTARNADVELLLVNSGQRTR